jgi:hypothetical protein
MTASTSPIPLEEWDPVSRSYRDTILRQQAEIGSLRQRVEALQSKDQAQTRFRSENQVLARLRRLEEKLEQLDRSIQFGR